MLKVIYYNNRFCSNIKCNFPTECKEYKNFANPLYGISSTETDDGFLINGVPAGLYEFPHMVSSGLIK